MKAPPSRTAGMTSSLSTAPSASPINSLREVFANAQRNIIAPSNDDVGAERRNQLFVFFRSIGDDRQSFGFRELDDVASISARRAGHCDDLTRRQLEQIERLARRLSVSSAS